MRDPNDSAAESGSSESSNAFGHKTTVEEFQVSGATLFTRLRSLLQQSNVRKIVIKTEEGRPLFTVPLTVGVAGGAFGLLIGPLFTIGITAIALLGARLTVSIEKSVD